MITEQSNWKKIIKPFLKEKGFFMIHSKQQGKCLILTYRKGELLATVEFYRGEVGIEFGEGENKQLFIEELDLLLT